MGERNVFWMMAFPRVCSSVVGSNTPCALHSGVGFITSTVRSGSGFFFSSSFLPVFCELFLGSGLLVVGPWHPIGGRVHVTPTSSLSALHRRRTKSPSKMKHIFSVSCSSLLVTRELVYLPPSHSRFIFARPQCSFWGKRYTRKRRKNGVRRGTGSRSSMINMDLREQMFLCMGKSEEQDFRRQIDANWRKWINLCLFIP